MGKEDDALVKELRAIKSLMILRLQREGARQSQIAASLGVSERTLGRMLPAVGSKRPAAAADEAE